MFALRSLKKALNVSLPSSARMTTVAAGWDETVHSAHITEVHEVPVKHLIRPLIPVLNEAKVKSLMETIQVKHIHPKVPLISMHAYFQMLGIY